MKRPLALRRWLEVPQSAGSREILNQPKTLLKSLIDEQKYLGSGTDEEIPHALSLAFNKIILVRDC
jgi:hypothetical protein